MHSSTGNIAKHVSRPTLVCNNCKSRKVKCDRRIPCSTCIRRGCESSCSYGGSTATEPSPSSSTSSVFGVFDGRGAITPPDSLEGSTVGSSALDMPTQKERGFDYTGVNWFANKDETINFFELENVVFPDDKPSHYGPLAWSFLLRKDFALGFVFEFASAMEKRREFLKDPRMSYQVGDTELVDQRPFENSSGQKRDDEYEKRISGGSINKYSICVDTRPPIVERVRAKLPKRSTLKKLLEAFVEYVGPFMSYVDPPQYYKDMERIVGPLDAPYEDYPDMKLDDENDLIYCGILLLTCRFGFLSLVSHTINLTTGASLRPLTEHCKDLVNNPIDLSIIELAEECFKKFNLLVRPNIALLQFALIMRVYQKFAPEFGEGLDGGDSQLFTGVLVQMAISIGLNRDPDSIPCLRPLPMAQKNLRRQMWYSLMFTDVIEAYSFGNPINCQPESYDTKQPKNIGPNGECAANRVYGHIGLVVTHLKQALRLALDVTGKTKVSDLCMKMNQVENFMETQFGTIESHLIPVAEAAERSNHISCLKICLSLKIFYLAIDTHLFLHYDQTNNKDLAYFYIRKILSISLLQFLPNIFVIISRIQEIHGQAGDLIVIPNCLQVMHRVFFNMTSLYVRIKFARYSWNKMFTEHDKDTIDTTDAILRGIDTIFNILQTGLSKLAHRYYYAYKILTSMKLIIPALKDPSFYASYYPGAVRLRDLAFDVSKLPEILEIINLSLTKLRETHKTQADLIILLNKGPALQPCGLPHSTGETNPATSEGIKSDTTGTGLPAEPASTSGAADLSIDGFPDVLNDDDIDAFFSRVLEQMPDELSAPFSTDSFNFDFFHRG